MPKFFQRAPLRCARACGSEEGIVSILTRHLRFGSGPRLSGRSGLLSIVPGGTGLWLVLAVSSGRKNLCRRLRGSPCFLNATPGLTHLGQGCFALPALVCERCGPFPRPPNARGRIPTVKDAGSFVGRGNSQ